MTFWRIWGHFEDQLRTWGLSGPCVTFVHFLDFVRALWNLLRTFWRPEDLMLSEHWRTFQELLMTSFGPIEDLRPLRISRTFQDIEDLCEPDYILRTLRTLANSWGFGDDLSTIWGPFRNSRTLRNFWVIWGSFEDLRPEDVLCIFLISWGLCGPFPDFLKTWVPEDLKTLRNFSGSFGDLLWTFWWLFLGTIEDFVRTIWWPFEELLTITGFWWRW